MPNYDLIAILGPTASGKTPFAAALAAELKTEIISADSRQVYRGMDLGTGKDLADYNVNGQAIPYHLIDIAEPGYKYNVFEYQRDFLTAYEDIRHRGMIPIACGGTGLYLEAVLKGYRLLPVPENPELRARLADKSLEELTELLKTYKTLHNTTDVDTAKRAIRAIEIEEYYLHTPVDERSFPQLKSLIIGVDIDRDLRREKITRRLKQRLDEGRRPHLLRTGIQIPDPLRHRPADLRRDVPRTGNRHPSVCQAADDMVQRHGTARLYHTLDGRTPAHGRKDCVCQRKTHREFVNLQVTTAEKRLPSSPTAKQ